MLVGCGVAVLAAAVLAVGFVHASSNRGARNDELAAAQARLAQVPAPAPVPASDSSLPQERQARVAAIGSALAQRVVWDRVLREVSLVLPDDVWLTTLSAQAPAP